MLYTPIPQFHEFHSDVLESGRETSLPDGDNTVLVSARGQSRGRLLTRHVLKHFEKRLDGVWHHGDSKAGLHSHNYNQMQGKSHSHTTSAGVSE